jgi:hypothetical protein
VTMPVNAPYCRPRRPGSRRRTQLVERLGQGDHVGDDQRGPHQRGHRTIARGSARPQHVDQVDDPDDLLAVVEDGVPRVPGGHARSRLGHRGGVADHVDPTRGRMAWLTLRRGKSRIRSITIDSSVESCPTRATPPPRARGRWRWRGVDVVDGLDTDRPEQQFGRLVEDPDQRPEHRQVERRRRRQARGDRVRAGDRVVLGQELAEEHLHHGREPERDDPADAHRTRPSGRRARGGGERLADERLGDVADQQARDRDAQLSARQHERRAAGDVEGTGGGAVAGPRATLQPRPVDRHVGEPWATK